MKKLCSFKPYLVIESLGADWSVGLGVLSMDEIGGSAVKTRHDAPLHYDKFEKEDQNTSLYGNLLNKKFETRRTSRKSVSSYLALLIPILVIVLLTYGYLKPLGWPWSGAREKFKNDVENLLLDNSFDNETSEAIAFLVNFMPDSDIATLSPNYVATNIRLALEARNRFKWGKDADWMVFLNEVLPYAVLAEPRDDWRQGFFVFMTNIVADCTTATCAAINLNRLAWSYVDPPIEFVAASPNELYSYSPFETAERHGASCTGLSIFLVDALRSVAVPARLAGVPHWNLGETECPAGDSAPKCGNHNWVEVYADGDWHFIDERGNTLTIDEGWFFPSQTNLQLYNPYSRNHSIYSTSWAPASYMVAKAKRFYREFKPADYFPMVWDWENTQINAFETVAWYHNKAMLKQSA